MLFDDKVSKLIGSYEKYYELKKMFLDLGFVIDTNDVIPRKDAIIHIYLDMPTKPPKLEDRKKSYLLALESSIIVPGNFEKNNYSFFNKIFTWNDELVDNKSVFKINYSFDFSKKEPFDKGNKKENLCCLVISNKSSNFENELYSERKSLIRWFEDNYLDEFDLYGVGWDTFRFERYKVARAINRLPYINKIIYKYFSKKYLSYKGVVDDKQAVVKKYKFSIAYENAFGERGYITEKIFDIFMSGTVPIYLGASNVAEYIPRNCFIDRREFDSNESLYVFLKNIKTEEYNAYRENINVFLGSKEAYQFTDKFFAKTIVENCIENEKY